MMEAFLAEKNNDDETDVMEDQSPIQITTLPDGTIVTATEEQTTVTKPDGTSETFPIQPTMDSPNESEVK